MGMTSIVTAYDAATGQATLQKPAPKQQPMYSHGDVPSC
jgi:hypothetical protein